MKELDQTQWDAVVVGAGIAGGVAAANLSKRGWRVLLLEKSKWPREKVCGGCLSSKAVALLEDAGLGLTLRGSQSVNRAIWHVGGQSLQLNAPGGIAILRNELDARIVAAAVERGCVFHSGICAKLLAHDGTDSSRSLLLRDANGTATVCANVVLACDGISGTLLADEPWAQWSVARGAWIGVSTTCDSWPSNVQIGAIHMHIGPGGYVGLVSVADGHTHLAAALDPATTRQSGGPASLIEQIIRSCNRNVPQYLKANQFRGTPTLTRYRKVLAGHRVLAIGDACGYVEPFTGEGMAWAIAGAQAAIQILPSPDAQWPVDMPMRWRSVHQTVIGNNQRWCRLLRPMMHHSTLAWAGVALGRSVPLIGQFVASRVCPPPSRALLPAQGDIG